MGNKDTLKFFDFCAGIGGGRLGLENNGLDFLLCWSGTLSRH